MHLISGNFSDFFTVFLLFFNFSLYHADLSHGRVILYSQCLLSQVNFNVVFLDSLGGEHSASGGENLRLSGLHEVAGKQSGFILIRE